jgi:Fur family zinc uptake transcriptional regulator
LKPHAHHERLADPDALIDEVARVCEERGLRLTALRRRVLELIVADECPVKAYDLLDRLRHERDGAAPPTVYRALDFLLEHGFIHRLESINAYTVCHHPSRRHAVPFLICDVCRHATELCDERVTDLLLEQARAHGFLAEAQTLEVHGVCRRCRDGHAPR